MSSNTPPSLSSYLQQRVSEAHIFSTAPNLGGGEAALHRGHEGGGVVVHDPGRAVHLRV